MSKSVTSLALSSTLSGFCKTARVDQQIPVNRVMTGQQENSWMGQMLHDS